MNAADGSKWYAACSTLVRAKGLLTLERGKPDRRVRHVATPRAALLATDLERLHGGPVSAAASARRDGARSSRERRGVDGRRMGLGRDAMGVEARPMGRGARECDVLSVDRH